MRLKAHTLRYVIPAKEVFWAFRYKSLGLSFAHFHEQDHDLVVGFYLFGSLGAAFEEMSVGLHTWGDGRLSRLYRPAGRRATTALVSFCAWSFPTAFCRNRPTRARTLETTSGQIGMLAAPVAAQSMAREGSQHTRYRTKSSVLGGLRGRRFWGNF